MGLKSLVKQCQINEWEEYVLAYFLLIWMACIHWYMMIPFWVQYTHFRYIGFGTNIIVSKLGILLEDILAKLEKIPKE